MSSTGKNIRIAHCTWRNKDISNNYKTIFPRRKNMKTIVIGVIGADVHAVGNKIIEYVLKNEGYNVVNVGVLSSQEDFINAAIETLFY